MALNNDALKIFADRIGALAGDAVAPTPQLMEMWRSVIRKAYQQPPDAQTIGMRVTSLSVNFDGGGQPLVIGMSGIPQMPAGAYRIIGCHLAAGIWDPVALSLRPAQVTCAVDIRLASLNLWPGGSQPIYGETIPQLNQTPEAEMDLTDWRILNLQPLDQLVFSLLEVTGTLTTITTTLSLRQIDLAGLGVESQTEEGTGEEFTDQFGFPMEERS